jgi:hypothetical protein
VKRAMPVPAATPASAFFAPGKKPAWTVDVYTNYQAEKAPAHTHRTHGVQLHMAEKGRFERDTPSSWLVSGIPRKKRP